MDTRWGEGWGVGLGTLGVGMDTRWGEGWTHAGGRAGHTGGGDGHIGGRAGHTGGRAGHTGGRAGHTLGVGLGGRARHTGGRDGHTLGGGLGVGLGTLGIGLDTCWGVRLGAEPDMLGWTHTAPHPHPPWAEGLMLGLGLRVCVGHTLTTDRYYLQIYV